jgi:4-hydroxy-2-oxoheptanedioate aldolase
MSERPSPTQAETNPFRRLLAGSEPVSGCWCTLPSPLIAESLAGAGFPCVVLDLQHGAASWDSLASLLQAVQLGGAAAIVRVGWNDPHAVMKALDLGASGVIVPMVNTAAEARSAASATRYPPQGERSYGQARRKHPSTDVANADVLCMPMIETAQGLRNVEEIAATDDVDGLFVGPADLGLSIGVGVSMRDPRVGKAIDEVVAAAARHGRFVGTIAADASHAGELLAHGVGFVCLGSDKGFIANGAATAYAELTAKAAEAGPTGL